MTEPKDTNRAPGYRTGRMNAFSDGVFAIAITLLILEIAVPAGSGDDLLSALGDQWPSYLAYFVSFATIGAVWFAHTVITEYLDHADSVLIRLNLLLLLVVSFLPFPTKLLAEYVHEADAERVAATVYGINLLLAILMVSVTWRYAVRGHLVKPDMADEDVKTLTKRLTPTLGLYVVMILLGLFLPLAAVVGYLALALFILIPFSAIRHRPSEA
ncbi:TMEM175 family protein [Streptomyces sp. NPDC088766]|uniref:TMEM175 family protein n=1 Tax=Streptomyces sp. NPDC088766 TaxID=3365893 RepID=UPI0037F37224